MAKARDTVRRDVAPDQRQLTKLQAERLAALSGVASDSLAGMLHADVAEKFKWRIDPELLFMRRICGQVVRRDPVTGELLPVPFATVHVEDTDCSFIGYFPKGSKWGWYYPFRCRREEIATVTTDECGRFCVWIPRFEIDWILRWRAERICFPDIFIRPSLEDILDEYVDGPWPPIKLPDKGDPPPFERLQALARLARERLAAHVGNETAQRIGRVAGQLGFGALTAQLRELKERRAFDDELPPPLNDELRAVQGGRLTNAVGAARTDDAVRNTIALQLQLDPKELATLDPRRFIGPFRRCVTVFVPQWVPILDVPDITFRVTQDTDGDGTEETIYNEGYFDVRWDSGSIPDVTLHAWPNAIGTRRCGTPVVRCGNAPEIQFAGRMPLLNPPLPAAPYFDTVAGYAKRANRTIPSGVVGDPMRGAFSATETPMCGMVSLYGCVDVAGAQYYRVTERAAGSSDTPAPMIVTMYLHRLIGSTLIPQVVSPDSNGWYAVRHDADGWRPPGLIIDWPTSTRGNREITVELADGSKNPLAGQVHTVNIQVDNTAPVVTYQTLRWKYVSEPDSAFFGAGRSLLGTCPTIRRGGTPHDVEVWMEVNCVANHLRDARIDASGCNLSSIPADPSSPSLTSHWHVSGSDNNVTLFARYRILASDAEGAYSFGAQADARAFNPAGGDGGPLADWIYDPVYIYTPAAIHVAIVNAS